MFLLKNLCCFVSVELFVDIVLGFYRIEYLLCSRTLCISIFLKPYVQVIVELIAKFSAITYQNRKIICVLIAVFLKLVQKLKCRFVYLVTVKTASIENHGENLLISGKQIAVSVIYISSRSRCIYGLSRLLCCSILPCPMFDYGYDKKTHYQSEHQQNNQAYYVLVSQIYFSIVFIHLKYPSLRACTTLLIRKYKITSVITTSIIKTSGSLLSI